ncbi:nitroreductase family protein [Xanthomonas graminis]|jgi:nitroreductase|uniref:Putative NAD(P)H nitroreductase n=1 Tax=Xanthomonas graminis pv. graminis TaxID=134874 RepID=A0A1M4JET4_9XANT|nr:nitroreductase [Xanthomonas translucens]EKU26354.1 Putative nitroreductase family protein [Xanthomonas translucens pv. graminis ART-Xtg29]OAX60762.1 nitroreductase [Xanthomonas translucens pv. graminis]UKE53793.1 nitroreductase [Xanthomonas translucens pv. graminis]WIH08112.1 nitroreductase [Xanthomonas translucens pv. graminis]WIH13136.1 nitroreductase [Xanthomonas translucens pv. graminis]
MRTLHSLQALDERRSVPSKQLGEPGPDEATLLAMLRSAVRVPDHGKLVPFRFLRIAGQARLALGDFLAERTLQLDPGAPPAAVEKDRERFAHAPLAIVVIARLQREAKVPEIEQWLSAGSVCFALLQAAQAHGVGAQWLTAWMAYDEAVAARLGLAENERIAGFIHIGTPRMQVPERERPDPQQLLSDWIP